MQLDIPIGVCEACFQFEAIDDKVVESVEDAILVFETNNPNDVVNGSTIIVIVDNDGMRLKMALSKALQLSTMKLICRCGPYSQ